MGCAKFLLAGIIPFFKHKADLIIPANPEKLSVCPILLLIDVSAQNCFFEVCSLNTLFKALNSMGSPIIVPVPCASINEKSSACTFAFFHAFFITSSCDSPFGEVIPFDFPS